MKRVVVCGTGGADCLFLCWGLEAEAEAEVEVEVEVGEK